MTGPQPGCLFSPSFATYWSQRYDARVLYLLSLRDLPIRLGQTGLFRAQWTEKILDEAIAAISRPVPQVNQ